MILLSQKIALGIDLKLTIEQKSDSGLVAILYNGKVLADIHDGIPGDRYV